MYSLVSSDMEVVKSSHRMEGVLIRSDRIRSNRKLSAPAGEVCTPVPVSREDLSKLAECGPCHLN